jgi:hypothetical protein
MSCQRALGLALLALTACDGASPLTRLNARLQVTPDPIVVPPAIRGQEVSVEVALWSRGSAALDVTALRIEGSEELRLDLPPLPLQIEAGASATLTLRYRPALDPAPAFLVVDSTDAQSPVTRIPIETSLKTGGVLQLCAEGRGLSRICAVDSADLDLGTVPVGEARTATITVESVGDAAFELESLGFGASASPEFVLSAITEPVRLAPGERVTRVLRFEPTAAGSFAGSLFARPVEGGLNAPRLDISARATLEGRICVDPASLDFGRTRVGVGVRRSLRVSACGSGPSVLTALTLPPGSPFALVSPPTLPLRLEPVRGLDLSLELAFEPTVGGPASAELLLQSDASSVAVPLTGNAATVPTGTLGCDNGETGRSWRDSLPLFVSQPPAARLAAASGAAALGSCPVGTRVTNPANSQSFQSGFRHATGRYYFEARVEAFAGGWSHAFVLAPPANEFYLSPIWTDEVSAAGFSAPGLGVISVLADLDAAEVFFYFDGVQVQRSSMLVIPGVGAFDAGGGSVQGDSIRLNFGADPFAYDVPAGYVPWASSTAAGGPCVSDANVPAPPAAIDVFCDRNQPCGPGATTFDSESGASPELVILGVYDAGSRSGWTWGTDANGNPIEVPTGNALNGSALVEVQRPGPIALVLTAYEPTDWTLVVAPGAELASVSAYGMHLQTVTGVPAGVPLDIHTICTGGDGGNCPGLTGEQFDIAAHAWPYDNGGGDTQGFVDFVEKRLCLPLEDFAGAYYARRFVVR